MSKKIPGNAWWQPRNLRGHVSKIKAFPKSKSFQKAFERIDKWKIRQWKGGLARGASRHLSLAKKNKRSLQKKPPLIKHKKKLKRKLCNSIYIYTYYIHIEVYITKTHTFLFVYYLSFIRVSHTSVFWAQNNKTFFCFLRAFLILSRAYGRDGPDGPNTSSLFFAMLPSCFWELCETLFITYPLFFSVLTPVQNGPINHSEHTRILDFRCVFFYVFAIFSLPKVAFSTREF